MPKSGDMWAALTDIFRRNEGIDDRIRPDRYASLSMRWVWRKPKLKCILKVEKINFKRSKSL